MKKILIIVDPQNDFITGSLAVPGAEAAMDRFKQFSLQGGLNQYDDIFVTIDFHPVNHCSFQSEGGIFPPHCVQHTWGAAISPAVETALSKNTNVHFYTKGRTFDKEEYSIFKGPNGINLAAGARFFRDVEIHVMGIAGDYCVHDTIADIIHDYTTEISSRITVLKDFIASIDGGTKLENLIQTHGLKAE